MGLTGGVKSHRLSGQISPYCEKKRRWLCAYCAPMFCGDVCFYIIMYVVQGGSNCRVGG